MVQQPKSGSPVPTGRVDHGHVASCREFGEAQIDGGIQLSQDALPKATDEKQIETASVIPSMAKSGS